MSRALTKAEQKLLRFPPTKRTWICVRKRSDGEKCETLNSGTQSICWCCGSLRPDKPKLLWPAYVRACAKAGIEPGDRWPPREAPSPAPVSRPKKRPVRRKV